MTTIFIKFRRETELVEVSLTASRVNSRPLHMQECRDESEIYNYQGIQHSNNECINTILGGTFDLA